jgi:metal-dependent HD superfamily phosphatase/phosphodiesterase
MASLVTYKYIKQNPDIMEYIRRADKTLEVMGYTEHSFPHVERVAAVSAMILERLGYDERTVELARIASMMHDIGNVINRIDHAQSGAVMAFRLLDNLSMPASEICSVIAAIGNHDEGTGMPLDPISAAMIIGDKTDVRRSRVRNTDPMTFDIHDRVNYAVEHAELSFQEDNTSLLLSLTIDTAISSVLEYFEIFLQRMLLCQKAAEFLGICFHMNVNGAKML